MIKLINIESQVDEIVTTAYTYMQDLNEKQKPTYQRYRKLAARRLTRLLSHTKGTALDEKISAYHLWLSSYDNFVPDIFFRLMDLSPNEVTYDDSEIKCGGCGKWNHADDILTHNLGCTTCRGGD